MEILLNKLIAIESRMEDNFSNLHTQISELTCEFKHEINLLKSTLNELKKSVNQAWASIKDLEQESKALKDSKSSHQKMMDELTEEIQGLKADLKKLQAENEKLKPALKEAQENLVTLENYTRRPSVKNSNYFLSQFVMNQHNSVGRNPCLLITTLPGLCFFKLPTK